jgi:hypothetical protein
MKNKCSIINRIVDDDIKRKMVKKIKDRGNTNYMYIHTRLYLPILNRLRQMVDFNDLMKF